MGGEEDFSRPRPESDGKDKQSQTARRFIIPMLTDALPAEVSYRVHKTSSHEEETRAELRSCVKIKVDILDSSP